MTLKKQTIKKIPVAYQPYPDEEMQLIYDVLNELEWDIKQLRGALKNFKNEL